MEYRYPRFDKLLTASDAVFRLVDRAGAFLGDPRTERLCFRALQEAVREVPIKHPWGYYKRLLPISLDGPSNHEVTRINTGSKLMLDSVTPWPANAINGHVLIDSMFMKVIKFDQALNRITVDYPVNVFTGDDVQWVHRVAEIPEVQRIHWLRDARLGHRIRHGLPQDIYSRDVLKHNTAGDITHFTTTNSNVVGLTDLIVHPAPALRQTLLLFATVRPQPMLVYRDEFVGCTVTGPRTFIVTSPVMNWYGCIVRVAGHLMTGKQAALREGRYNWQSIVKDINIATGEVTVADDLPPGFATEDVLVSSLVDIDVQSMNNYVEALAYSKYCLNHKHEGLGRAQEAEKMILAEARALDNKIDWSSDCASSAFGYLGLDSDAALWLNFGSHWNV